MLWPGGLRRTRLVSGALGCATALWGAAVAHAAGSAPPVAFPHPLITEVLFAVPTDNGDANRDGTRQVAGDEFVEIVNPHAQAIELRGYKILDRGSASSAGRPPEPLFVFPFCRLEPGQVVVVFNGHASTIAAPVGDSRAAPAAGHPGFGGALVFSMRAGSQRASFNNSADHCLLVAPDGIGVHLVRWGPEPGGGGGGVPLAMLSEVAPVAAKGSVERRELTGPWVEVRGAEGRGAFTPGSVPWAKPPAADPPTVPRVPPTGPVPKPPSSPISPSVPAAPAPPAEPAPAAPPADPESQPTPLALENQTGRTLMVELGVIYRVGGVSEGSAVPRSLGADSTLTHTFPGGGPGPRPYVRVALADGGPGQSAIVRLLPPGRPARLVVRLAPAGPDAPEGRGGGLVIESP